jgi:15-cis-phytoene synthase
VSEVADHSPLASFEAKWAQAHPEFGLALKFVDPATRAAQSAFACLVHELEHAAFGIREAQPAAIKLRWWGEEFARAARHEARHPLTQALATHPGFGAIALAQWVEVIAGALAQRDPEPAADAQTLLQTYAMLHRPLAAIEAGLFSVDAASLAHVRTLSRALRETAALGDALGDGRLPLPLDLLARHRLARGDLARAAPAQVAALREWLGILHSESGTIASARCGPLGAASASADRWRMRGAAKADDPVAALHALFARLPLRTLWAAWRAGRRMRG